MCNFLGGGVFFIRKPLNDLAVQGKVITFARQAYGFLYRDHTLSYGSVLDLGMDPANEFNDSVEAQHDSLRMLRGWGTDSRTRGNTRNVRMLTWQPAPNAYIGTG